jgi:hypothetical protein
MNTIEHPRITEVGRLLARIADLEAQLKDAYELAYDVARHDMEVQFAKAEAENERLRQALRRAERKLTAYVGVCNGDKELTDAVLPMVRAVLTRLEEAGR